MIRLLKIGVAALAVAASACAGLPPAEPEVRGWITSADRSRLLAEQPPLAFEAGAADEGAVLALDARDRRQTMVGFGAAITDAAAWLIQTRLTPDRREALLRQLFGRADGGLGFSFTRVTIGASDFSLDHYSLDDPPGGAPDPRLDHFSAARMAEHVFPTVRQALAINPDLKVMASPWSAPAWMKTSGSLVKGLLKRDYYPVYADYFRRYIAAAAAEGVPTDYVSIQNEPDFEPENYPGMRWPAADRAVFIGDHLGPTLRRAGLDTRILDWDHNWDQPEQPMTVLADPEAAAHTTGVAWHCYAGDVSAQSRVHEAYPDKETFFTECSGGEWAADFGDSFVWMTRNLIIGATDGWARGVLMWNLALDQDHGPHAGGCGECRGVVTLDSRTGEITRNQEYYAFGHASRFVLPGATRVGVSRVEGLPAVAFVNPDGGRALIVLNEGAEARTLTLKDGGRSARAVLPGRSAATYVWDGPPS